MTKISPPYMETVQKYCTDTNENLVSVQTKIAEFAAKLRTKNLDVAAWAWVQSVGKAPPTLKADAPFTMVDKPYLTLGEVLSSDSKIGENTGFNVRGHVFNVREWTSKEGKPGLAVVLGDESGMGEVVYFGKQVDAVRSLKLQLLDTIFVGQAQLSRNTKDQKLSIRCSGPYSETKRMVPADKGLGPVTSIAVKPINAIQVYETAYIKGMAFDTSKLEYAGCPNCNSKLTDKVPYGKNAECPGNPEKRRASCGQVPSTKMVWTTIRVNDDEGEIACKFSPDFDIKGEDFVHKYLYLVGKLSDRGDFNVIWFLPEDMAGKLTPPASVATIVESVQTPMTPTTPTVLAPPAAPQVELGPVLIKYLKLFPNTSIPDLVKFAATKKATEEAAKEAISGLIDLGSIVNDNGKVRVQ